MSNPYVALMAARTDRAPSWSTAGPLTPTQLDEAIERVRVMTHVPHRHVTSPAEWDAAQVDLEAGRPVVVRCFDCGRIVSVSEGG